MSWQIGETEIIGGRTRAFFWCDTSDQAFGPMMADREAAEEVARRAGGDPRAVSLDALDHLYGGVMDERENAPTDADTEAGRGEGRERGGRETMREVEAMTDAAVAEHVSEEAHNQRRKGREWMADRLDEAARRLRESDPGGCPPHGPWLVSAEHPARECQSCGNWFHLESAAPTDEAPSPLDGRAYLTEGHDGELPTVEEGERGESDTYAEIGAALVLAYEDGRRLQDVVVREDVLRKIKSLADLSAPEARQGEGEHPARKVCQGRECMNVDGEFQSAKFPWCPPGFLPLAIHDGHAADLLLEYADRREHLAPEFTEDLRVVVRDHWGDDLPFGLRSTPQGDENDVN